MIYLQGEKSSANLFVMKEARFIARNREKWGKMEQRQQLEADQLAADFIELSDDLAYARTFYPGSDTERYLNQLLGTYLSDINRGRPIAKKAWWKFWVDDYPLLIAEHYKTLLFVLGFFLMSVLTGVFSTAHEESFVRLILGDSYVNMTLDNISKGKPMGVYAQGDAMYMFIRIAFNNIKVAFVAFAYGIFFSAGTLWILFFNGIMLGTFQYFFYQHGLFMHSVFSVWAHGTFEITSIIIAGGAGLILGNSFLFPGTYPRMLSFRLGALKSIKVVTGLVPFFIIAGIIESFITRYADDTPVVGAVTMLLSLIGVLWYFVVRPYQLNHKLKNGYKGTMPDNDII